MKELHALVDFENVQPTFEELATLAPGCTDVWLFHGPHQARQAQQLAADHSGVTLVPRSGKGPNALDFHLAFYLGYVAARHPAAHFVVVANDRGYDPVIAHARMLKFTVKRVGRKAKPPITVKSAAKTAAKSAAMSVAPTAAKKPARAAKAAPAKKAATAKALASVKKAPAKKTQTKQAPAKKAANPKTPAPKVPAQSQAAVPAESKDFIRIKNGLAKMGDKAPHKLQAFLRHIGALLGKGSTAEQIDGVVQKLEKSGLVRIAGIWFCTVKARLTILLIAASAIIEWPKD